MFGQSLPSLPGFSKTLKKTQQEVQRFNVSYNMQTSYSWVFTQWPKQLLFPTSTSSFCLSLISQQLRREGSVVLFKKWQIMTRKIHHWRFCLTCWNLFLPFDFTICGCSDTEPPSFLVLVSLQVHFILLFPEYKSVVILNIIFQFVTWVNCPFNML